MAEPKKFVWSAEWDLEKRTPERDKKNNQKLKPYVVLQYLLKHTDELHVATASDIIGIEPQRIEQAIQNHAQLL